MTATLQQTRTLCRRFESADLRDTSLIADLVELICYEYEVEDVRRADLELVLAEAVNNAIDHGVLGLDSEMKKSAEGFGQYFISRAEKLDQLAEGGVYVSVEQLSIDTITISVTDSGPGFDVPTTLRSLQTEILSSSYGRGLLIMRHLCESINHSGCGNSVVMEFRISCR